MTKQEFEERTGIVLTDEQFAPINWMYVNAGNMQKNEFCKEYKEHGHSQLLKALMDRSEEMESEFCKARAQVTELALFMVDQADKNSSPELRLKAIELLGLKAYLRVKLERGYSLWSIDREDLLNILNSK